MNRIARPTNTKSGDSRNLTIGDAAREALIAELNGGQAHMAEPDDRTAVPAGEQAKFEPETDAQRTKMGVGSQETKSAHKAPAQKRAKAADRAVPPEPKAEDKGSTASGDASVAKTSPKRSRK